MHLERMERLRNKKLNTKVREYTPPSPTPNYSHQLKLIEEEENESYYLPAATTDKPTSPPPTLEELQKRKQEQEAQKQREEEQRKKDLETARLKDIVLSCITYSHVLMDILYYEEIPKFENNTAATTTKIDKEKQAREEEEEERRTNNLVFDYPEIEDNEYNENKNIIPSHSLYTGLYSCMLLMEKYLTTIEKYNQDDLRNFRVKAEQGVNDILMNRWKDFV
jgi:hypothetical protein